MAVTLKQTETEPASWPYIGGPFSEGAWKVPKAAVWQRIEAWTSRRWGQRAVVWIVEGPGEWEPPLTPATVSTVERWDGAAWVTDTADPSPLGGYDLPSEGPWRFTGTVGDDTVAPAVAEAFRRLTEYVSDSITPSLHHGRSGARSTSYTIDGLTVMFSRDPAWMAKAMANSGAGDLLRPYRKVR